jgi:dynein heavy chain
VLDTAAASGGFELDYYHLLVVVRSLESTLHSFINARFDNARNTDAALRLLGQFSHLLSAELLRDDLGYIPCAHCHRSSSRPLRDADPPLTPRVCSPNSIVRSSKLSVIFSAYALDLEEVTAMYEAHKHAPPIPRGFPPVAGRVVWARQLLRRIEGPMAYFARHEALLANPSSAKIVKQYNRIAKVTASLTPKP